MATEAPQEFAENVLGNLGAASGGATIPWDQGAVEGATKAAIMSAVPGGAAGVVSGVQARGQLDAKTALDQAKAREAAEKLNTQTSVGLQTIQSAQSVDEIISAAVVATEPVKSPTLALPAPGSQADSGVLVDDGGQLRPQTLEEQAQSRAARVRAERDAYERQQLGPTDDVLRAQSVRNSPVSRETLSSGEEDAGNRPGVPAGIGDTGRAGPTASGLAGAGTGIEGIGRPANDNQPTVAPVPGIARGDVSGVVSEEVRQSSDSEDAVYPSGMAALQARLKSGRVKTHEPVQLADGFRLVPKGTGQIARLMMGDLARDMAKPEPRDRSPKDTLRAHIRKIGGVTPQSLRTALGLKKTARERKSYIGYANTKGQSLDALVSSGSLDDYLPFDLRQNDNDAPDVAGDKEARATEYIADRIAEGGDTKPYNPIPDDEPQGQAEPWADVQKRLARIARKLAKASARDARLKDNAAQAERDTAIREAIADVRAAEAARTVGRYAVTERGSMARAATAAVGARRTGATRVALAGRCDSERREPTIGTAPAGGATSD